MNLYEISKEIEQAFDNAIDEETGEIISEAAIAYIDQLQMERDKKIENIGCWIKNLTADAYALKMEESALKDRRISAEKKAESLKRYLSSVLMGEKFQTTKVKISWRRSEQVEVENTLELPEEYQKTKIDIQPDKTKIKKAIKAGEEVEGATLIEKQNIQIN